MKSVYGLIFLLLFANCTMAPFREPHTAQTLGKGNNELSLGLGRPGYFSASFTKGVRKDLDLKFLTEIQFLGALVGGEFKWWLNPVKTSYPFALIAGAGLGTSTSFIYFGPVQSFKISPKYYLTLNARYNVFRWDISDSGDANDAATKVDRWVDGVFDSINGSHSYVSLGLSNTLMLNQKVGLTLSLSALKFISERHIDRLGLYGSLNLNFKM